MAVVYPHNKFWNHQLIINSIQRLQQAGQSLNVRDLWRNRSNAVTKLLIETTGKATTGSSLHEAACRYFGSWDIALRQSGVDVQAIKEKPFWTKEKIITAIRALHMAGIPLNSGRVERDCSQKTAHVIKESIGKERNGRSLIGGARRVFGSWDLALQKASLSVSSVRLENFRWNKPTIRKILKTLHESNVPLNVASISTNKSEQIGAITLKSSGRKIKGGRIYHIGRTKLGSWDEILKYSGFILSMIRKNGARCEQNKNRIIEYIQAIHMCEIALNTKSVMQDSKKIQLFLEERFGRPVSGYSVMNTAKKLFGSWDRALWEAGLDPNKIRLVSRPHTTNLPVVLYQIEDIKIDGERWRTKYLGAPPKSPDQVLEEKDAATKLRKAMDEMSESDQQLAEKIFDAILQIHHYKDQKQLIQFVVRRLDGRITEKKVASLFRQLAKSTSQ